MKKASLFLIIALLFIGCNKSEENTPKIEADLPPTNFTITTDEVSDKSANIVWTAAKDPENKAVTYDVYLNGQLIESKTSALTFTFEELSPETNYTGQVIASDGAIIRQLIFHLLPHHWFLWFSMEMFFLAPNRK